MNICSKVFGIVMRIRVCDRCKNAHDSVIYKNSVIYDM